MQTTNDRMTEEQVSDLLHLTAVLQSKAEARNDRDTAVMAYAVQKVCLELTESRLTSKASEQQLTESRREFTAANATIHNLELSKAELAAELSAIEVIHNDAAFITDEHYEQCPPAVQKIIGALAVLKIPAYDAYLAEVRSQARNEGINYAASRLAAAFNHGFVDKPLAEVYDVVRMILTTKEDLANAPAADGLSGEYAEKSLVEFAAQLRQGAEHE